MSSSAAGVVLAPIVIRLDHGHGARSAAPPRPPSSERSFSAALHRARTRSAAPDPLSGMELLRDAARRVARGDRLLDRTVRAARAGRVFGNEELITLQASVYRYSQELELASELVDKSTSAVKYVLQSQR